MYKEKQVKKIYWTIGEVAKSLNIATSAIRFYESILPELKPGRHNGKRRYVESDIKRLTRFVKLMQSEWYTIPGAIHFWKENK